LDVTRTVGGVISGYSATGKKPAAMAPSRMITTEITHARTGRSMKKRASMTVLHKRNPKSEARNPKRRQPAFWSFGFRGLDLFRISCFGFRIWLRHVHQLRLHGDARAHLLQAVD